MPKPIKLTLPGDDNKPAIPMTGADVNHLRAHAAKLNKRRERKEKQA